MVATLLDASSPLRSLRKQVRLLRRRLTVLCPKNDYYVQGECMAALRALGHRVVEVRLGTGGEVEDVSACLGLMMRACVAHRPDMLLTINYTGFDRAAWFDEIVEAMGLPVAVWFVDSPFFLAVGYLPPAPSVTSFFSWDASYVPVLRMHGAQRVFHLPLATDPEVFCASGPQSRYRSGFVGHTMDALVDLWAGRDRALSSQELKPSPAHAWAERLQADRSCLHALVPKLAAPVDPQVIRLGHANYLASRALRQRLLGCLPQGQLHLFGNDAWRQRLPGAHHHNAVSYGTPLAQIYRACEINLNITNLQMPTGVNQRLFDVPAAGSFLLTDAQAELERYFEPGREVATFACAEELRDKQRFFARNAAARRDVAEAGRRRVLAQHTYVHRMQSLIATMRCHHGPGTSEPKGMLS